MSVLWLIVVTMVIVTVWGRLDRASERHPVIVPFAAAAAFLLLIYYVWN